MNVDAGPPTGTGDAGPATGSSVLLRRVVPAALFLGVAVVLYALSIVGAGRLGSHTLQTLRAGSSWRKILRPADTELPYADKPDRARSQKDPWEIAPEAANATSPDEPVYVALCLPVKDDHLRIREWVQYHQMIGVGRMYIYDDGSKPPMRSQLADFIKSGLVHYRYLTGPLEWGKDEGEEEQPEYEGEGEVVYYPEEEEDNEEGTKGQKVKPEETSQGPQESESQEQRVYNDCIQSFRDDAKWLGMLNGDEFIIVMDGSPDLPTVLKRYENYGGLGINWRMFGSSGYEKPPPGGLLENFVNCTSGLNEHIKTIVNTKYVERAGHTSHDFFYKDRYFAVNTNRTKVQVHHSHEKVDDVLVLNHYILRSAEEYKRKVKRGYSWDLPRNQEFFNGVNRSAKRICDYAVPLGRKVQEKLEKLAEAAGRGRG